MNSTASQSHTTFSNDYLTIALSVAFILSEVLPFIKKNKGNGLLDSIICLLRGSECLTKKLADTLETVENKEVKIEIGEKNENN
tara:strand:+ start:1502 stop:1753 length:252 start_codon:yes stop_codon:yes gene_type:complete